jgi:hypothetical protein
MADKKISALTGATTPLAGSEVLPIVQGGATVKVSVDNLTTGKTVAGLNFKTNSATALGQYTAKLVNTAGVQTMFAIENATSAGQLLSWTHNLSTDEGVIGTDYGGPFSIKTQGVSRVTVSGTSGDTTLVSGNLVQGTAAKGINFTANTPAAGMTSQLLNWYEEGTWTPNQGSGLTLVGAFSSVGRYVRVGKAVSISGSVSGATSVAILASGELCTNAPFGAGTLPGIGGATNVNASAASILHEAGTFIYAVTAIAATTTIYFSVTFNLN